MAELEGKGLDYERYALNKLFHELVRTYGIKSVLELPAKGEKAMPSIYSVALAQAGCDVTLVNAEEKSSWAWNELGFPVDHRIREVPQREELFGAARSGAAGRFQERGSFGSQEGRYAQDGRCQQGLLALPLVVSSCA